MKIPLTPRLKYVPTGLVNEYERCVEIPDAPSVLDVLPTFGLKRPRDPVRYETPDIIKMPQFLLPHQQTAVRQLYNGGILSDAPRMGKTVTALGWTHVQKRYHPDWTTVTIICPAVLKTQWTQHVERFGHPELDYRVVSMDAPDFPSATDMLIVDEARHFKHSTTSRFQKLYYMYRRITLCLEAVPVSDRGTDIFGLLHLVREHWFPSIEQFKTWYVLPISKYEPLMERLREDTKDLWVWRSKKINRQKIDHDFTDEKEALQFIQNLPRPLVVFTDTRRRAESLGKKLGAEILTGDYKLDVRGDSVRRFQEGEIDCLVCTFWSAGEGLDLSQARSCATYGWDWTPATIEQAIARTDHIDPARKKADVHLCAWPGDTTYKRSVVRVKNSFLPQWAEDIGDKLVWR